MISQLYVKYDNDKIRENAPFKKALKGDAAFDLYNASDATITIAPYESIDISAGVSVKIPDGHCGLIVARSSTPRKRRLFVITGLIDSGYTGPLCTLVWHPNFDGMCRPVLIEPWERLGQLVVLPVSQMVVSPVQELPKTARGDKGFGSTGR